MLHTSAGRLPSSFNYAPYAPFAPSYFPLRGPQPISNQPLLSTDHNTEPPHTLRPQIKRTFRGPHSQVRPFSPLKLINISTPCRRNRLLAQPSSGRIADVCKRPRYRVSLAPAWLFAINQHACPNLVRTIPSQQFPQSTSSLLPPCRRPGGGLRAGAMRPLVRQI